MTAQPGWLQTSALCSLLLQSMFGDLLRETSVQGGASPSPPSPPERPSLPASVSGAARFLAGRIDDAALFNWEPTSRQ